VSQSFVYIVSFIPEGVKCSYVKAIYHSKKKKILSDQMKKYFDYSFNSMLFTIVW